MALRSPTVPFSQMDQRQSDQYARNVPVVPDNNSTGSQQIQDRAVTEPKLADGAVSTRATANNAVTNEKLRDSGGCSVIGRSQSTDGDPADIPIDANGKFLVRRAGQLTGDIITDDDIPASIARDSEVTAAIAAHAAALDPHPGYLTPAEADALYQPLTAALGLVISGAGSPEGAVTATVGHIYLRTDGGAGTTLYVKESGSGNTGWIGK